VIRTVHDHRRRAGGLRIVGLVRPDRPAWVQRSDPGDTLILAARRSDGWSCPDGSRCGCGLVGHCRGQLGPCWRTRRRPCCGWPPRNRSWRLRRAHWWLTRSLRRRRRSRRGVWKGRACAPGLDRRSRLRRRSRRGSGRRGRRRGGRTLDSGEFRGRRQRRGRLHGRLSRSSGRG
jgi:hypothetical protein